MLPRATESRAGAGEPGRALERRDIGGPKEIEPAAGGKTPVRAAEGTGGKAPVRAARLGCGQMRSTLMGPLQK